LIILFSILLLKQTGVIAGICDMIISDRPKVVE